MCPLTLTPKTICVHYRKLGKCIKCKEKAPFTQSDKAIGILCYFCTVLCIFSVKSLWIGKHPKMILANVSIEEGLLKSHWGSLPWPNKKQLPHLSLRMSFYKIRTYCTPWEIYCYWWMEGVSKRKNLGVCEVLREITSSLSTALWSQGFSSSLWWAWGARITPKYFLGQANIWTEDM